MNEERIKILDIIFSGNLFLLIFGITYFCAERLHLVPIIRLIPNGSNPHVDDSDILTILEEFLILLILLNVVWIISQLLYWILIRKKRIEVWN